MVAVITLMEVQDHINAASSSDFGMGTGDFIEAWVHPTQMYSSNFIVCLSASDSIFGYDSDGSVDLQLPSSGAPALTQLGPKIANNKWNHIQKYYQRHLNTQ